MLLTLIKLKSTARDLSPAMRAAMEANPYASYIKEMSFKGNDQRHVSTQLRLIKELQKRIKARTQVPAFYQCRRLLTFSLQGND